jgi:2-polyprenyl-6-hydroxyphenyl methylase/3-demethylubiquinone-9 3-methyltransferase
MFPTACVGPQNVCKCCGNVAKLYDVCDFSKNCEEHKGLVLPMSGIAVYYYKCSHCGFIFTSQFDKATHDEFTEYIYNDEYIKVDPDYVTARPAGTANQVNNAFGAYKKSIRILDYGGGNGMVEQSLKEMGFNAVDTYDPFSEQFNRRPSGQYDLVLSFEVVEHIPNVIEVFQDMKSFLSSDSMIIFSTLIQPDDIDKGKAKWWYIAPRNGHISIHSQRSLQLVLNGMSLKYVMASQNIHFAFDRVPSFAKHIIKVS